MNAAQDKVLKMILENADKVNWDKIKEIMGEVFAKQDMGKLSQLDLVALVPKLSKMVKPENAAAVLEMVKNLNKSGK